MIDLEKLRSFYYVIAEGSILKASILLNRNRVTINKHLLDLEKYCNAKLFVRKRKRFELTEKGQALFNLAQNSIANIDKGFADIIAAKNESHHLRIITTTGIIGIWLIRKLKIFMEEFPHVNVSIITTSMDVDFENSKADIGILQRLITKGLSQKKIKTFHSRLFASQEYLKKYGTPKTLDDLDSHKLISYYSNFEGNLGDVDWHLKKGNKENRIRNSHLRVNAAFLMFEAVCQGMGIMAVGEEFEYLKNSNLVEVLPHEGGLAFDIHYGTVNKVKFMLNFFFCD
jgi:DNA-binding transcriptional LysR family regulator